MSTFCLFFCVKILSVTKKQVIFGGMKCHAVQRKHKKNRIL